MRFDNVLHLGLPVLCGGFALLVCLNFLLLFHAQTEMHRIADLETAVLSETRRLNNTEPEKLIARYATLQVEEDAVAARKSYAELLAALAAWPDTLGKVVGQSDYVDEKLSNILNSSGRVQPFLEDLDNQTTLNNALILLQGIGNSLQQINQMVTQEVGRQVASAREAFRFHQVLQTGLVLGLVFTGLGWIGLLNARSTALRKEARGSSERAEQFRQQLRRDRVTGLINSEGFADRIRAAAEDLEDGQTLSILNIDLENRFPARNKFSRIKENALLASTSDLLRHAVDRLEGVTCLARSEGKGFLLMAVTDDDLEHSAPVIANRIHDIFLRPVPTELGSFLISPVIGYADSRKSDRAPADIIRNADLAVANAVDHSRRHVVTYEPVMRAEMERQTIVENALARAIEANECLPHFQPQFNLKSGRIFGVEALARWYHSELGWISPSEFIPIAESNGDIVSLGWKILETSCSEVQLLPADLTLSVNLSVSQILSDDVVAMMDECLERTGLPASKLKLEVTEATLMSDLKRIQTTLSDLRALGIGISLDDFGVGYTALSYLTDFHWDEIKIDRSFAVKAVRDRKIRDILKLVLGIAETMGSEVLIEGIETVEQRDVLVDLGCINGQGYLFGGPMAIDDITTLFFNDQGQKSFAGV